MERFLATRTEPSGPVVEVPLSASDTADMLKVSNGPTEPWRGETTYTWEGKRFVRRDGAWVYVDPIASGPR